MIDKIKLTGFFHLKRILVILFAFPFVAPGQDISQIWSLDACINYALQNNLKVQQYTLEKDQAQVNLINSQNLFLPTIEGRLRNIHNWGLFVDPTTNILTTRNSEIYTGSIEAEWTIFNGGLNYYSIKKNQELYNASASDLQAINNQVTLQIVASYYGVLLASEQKRIAEQQKIQVIQQYELAKGLVEKGIVHRRELLLLESQMTMQDVVIVSASNDYLRANLELRQAMGIRENKILKIDDALVSGIPDSLSLIDYDTLCSNAQFFLPEVNAAKYRVNARQYTLKQAQSYRYPSLVLETGVLTKSSSLIQTEQPIQFRQNLSEYISFNLRVPIFNRFQYQNNIDISQIDLRLRENELKQVNQEIEQKIQEAYLELSSSYKKYWALNKQAEALKAQYIFSEKSYTAGIISFTEFSYTSNLYLNSQLLLSRAKYDYFYKRKVLSYYEEQSHCSK
ncbi:MAG: TolC family protein [Cytophagaceae bacterium]|nr:TolC family protein [Cytophagaceae bacterium]